MSKYYNWNLDEDSGEWCAHGLCYDFMYISKTEDDKFYVSLCVLTDGNRYDPPDLRHLDGCFQSSLETAQLWAMGKDHIAAGNEMINEIPIVEMEIKEASSGC